MKYKQLLETNMVPEWRNQYIDYHGLDAALNKAIESKNMKARQKGVDLYFELIKFNQKFANYFSRECQAQLDKINTFHKEKLNEMKGKFNNLNDQLDQVLSSAIYRKIQPDLASCNHRAHHNNRASLGCQACEHEAANSTSVRASHDVGCSHCGPHNSPRLSLANLLPRLSQRLSLAPIFGGGAGGGSCCSGSTSTCSTKERPANLNLRLGKEKMTVMTRKFSESFLNSAFKISANLTSIHNTFNYEYRDETATLNDDMTSKLHWNPVAQKLNHGQPMEDTDGLGAMRRAGKRSVRSQEMQQNFQTLAGPTPLSKSKIVASYKKKLSNLKFAFRELYFNLVLFEQYTQLNHNGLQQILRKHDRMFASSLGRKFYEEHVQTADFYNDLQAIDHLIENVEHIYTLHFENGNRRRAIEKLQVPTNVYEPSSPKLDFRVGYEFGMFSVLFILVVLVGLVSDTGYDWRTVFKLYRSPLVLIIFLFQTGISIVIWKHYKINHVLIFELNPRDNLSSQHFIEFGSQLGIIWSISVLLFLFSDKCDIKPSILPLIVVLIIVIYLFNPTQTCGYQARFWLIKRLVGIYNIVCELSKQHFEPIPCANSEI